MGSIGKELFLLSFYSIHPATVGVARLSRASLAPTDQAFFRGNRWASQAQRQPTGLRQLRGAEIRRALCRPEREAGCREQAAGMRRESALAQGCAIADAPGSLPVSEDSGGSGRQGRGLRGHGLMPPYRPRQAAGWQIAEADNGRNGPNPIKSINSTVLAPLRQAQGKRIGGAVNVGLRKLSANLPEPSSRREQRPRARPGRPGRQKAGVLCPLKATIRRRPHQVGPS